MSRSLPLLRLLALVGTVSFRMVHHFLKNTEFFPPQNFQIHLINESMLIIRSIIDGINSIRQYLVPWLCNEDGQSRDGISLSQNREKLKHGMIEERAAISPGAVADGTIPNHWKKHFSFNSPL